MTCRSSTWAVVLAAGDGTRLAALTPDAFGNLVPKQFCSLNGGRALIEETLQRARHVASPERICTIVAQQHATHWRRLLDSENGRVRRETTGEIAMRLLLRTMILLPLALAIAIVVLLAIGVRVACLELLRSRPCAEL